MLNIHRSTRGQHYASRKQYGDETRNPEPAYQTRRARSYRSSGESQRENRTDFVLEAARAAAEEALIEQRIIMADPEAYQEFLVRLIKHLHLMPHCVKPCRPCAVGAGKMISTLSRFMPDIFLLRFAAVWIL